MKELIVSINLFFNQEEPNHLCQSV